MPRPRFALSVLCLALSLTSAWAIAPPAPVPEADAHCFAPGPEPAACPPEYLEAPPLPGAPPPSETLETVGFLPQRTDKGLVKVSFPPRAATAHAIRRLAAGAVPTRRNGCARTMRAALGWGMGDAHQWVKLPERGFARRPSGAAAQPGDIVVWPFTFGRRRSQHVGVAVGTEAGVRLLSNLCGSLALSALVPGYEAFHRLRTESAGDDVGAKSGSRNPSA